MPSRHGLGANVAIEMGRSPFSGSLALLSPRFSCMDESMVPRTLDRLAAVADTSPSRSS